jgi:hypothetical protein
MMWQFALCELIVDTKMFLLTCDASRGIAYGEMEEDVLHVEQYI